MGSPREEQRRGCIHAKYSVSVETGAGVANALFYHRKFRVDLTAHQKTL